MSDLSLNELTKANKERQKDWASENWSLGEWMCALTGEVGEAANIVKKIFRGDKTLGEARSELGKEFADILTYLSITADKAGVNLSAATIDKFNEVSERVGSDVTLKPRTDERAETQAATPELSKELIAYHSMYDSLCLAYETGEPERLFEVFENIHDQREQNHD